MKKYGFDLFWEEDDAATIGVDAVSPFALEAGEIQKQIDEEVTEADDPQGAFSYKWQLENAKRRAALRIKMTCKALDCFQRDLAHRIGMTPENLSRIVSLKNGPDYETEKAIFRETLAVAMCRWVEDWYVEEAKEEFAEALAATKSSFEGHPFDDNFTHILYTIGVVCGNDGWRDFWEVVGRHILRIPSYETSSDYYASRVSEEKRKANRAAAEGINYE